MHRWNGTKKRNKAQKSNTTASHGIAQTLDLQKLLRRWRTNTPNLQLHLKRTGEVVALSLRKLQRQVCVRNNFGI